MPVEVGDGADGIIGPSEQSLTVTRCRTILVTLMHMMAKMAYPTSALAVQNLMSQSRHY